MRVIEYCLINKLLPVKQDTQESENNKDTESIQRCTKFLIIKGGGFNSSLSGCGEANQV